MNRSKSKSIISSIFFVIILLSNLASAQGSVKEYFITCDSQEFDYIYEHPYEEIYIPITLTLDDRTWIDAEMRIRGDDTRMHPKKSLKIKFNGELFLNERKKINFNAEYEDASYICQFLAARAFKMAGYPCFEAEHARLYVNGEYLGLYLQIENMDREFLADKGLDPKGNLYKATKDDASLSIYDDVFKLWEKKTNDRTDRDDLLELIDSLYYTADADYYDFAHRYLNYEKMITILAMNMLLANGSTYYHNYYMYNDLLNSKKWMMLPWDMDKTLYKYGYLYPYHRSSSYSSPDNPFLERALNSEPIFKDIRSKINFLIDSFFNNEVFDPIIDSLEVVLRSSVEQDITDEISDINVWIENLGHNKKFISKRPEILGYQFDNWPRSFKVEVTHGVYPENIKFKWNSSYHPQGKEITYNFYFGESEFLNADGTTVTTGIPDTFFVMNEITPGVYYWKVTAYDGTEEVDGFNQPNKVIIKSPTEVLCNINTNMVLTKKDSPYILNCDLNINSSLTLKEGVTLLINKDFNINVNGQLKIEGTKAEPVIIKPLNENESWGKIDINNAECIISNSVILEGVIEAVNSDLFIDSSSFESISKDLSDITTYISMNKGNFRFINSSLKGKVSCEGINVRNTTAEVINSKFMNTADAIELTSAINGVIRNNIVINSTDDAIDVNNSQNVIITDNYLQNVSDKGISVGNEEVGPSRNVLLQRNIIINCDIGIAVKDASDANIINNTLYDCNTGIKSVEKTEGLGGGIAIITNTIISNSVTAIIKDNKSVVEISYSLCDTESLAGIGNIQAEPQFINADTFDFHLKPDSPCIDKGNPASPLDNDKTRADIGALQFINFSYIPEIIINEINYNASNDFDTGDWVELYNADNSGVDISGWIFKDNNDAHSYIFPSGTNIAANAYLILCRNTERFKDFFPNVQNVKGDFDFGLSSKGEMIRLFDDNGNTVDSLTFDIALPWPNNANGTGKTIELIQPDLDNTIGGNWQSSVNNGTPGKINGLDTSVETNDNVIIISNYPNPFSNKTTIRYFLSKPSFVRIVVYNTLGNIITRLVDDYQNIGQQAAFFNTSRLSEGLYFYTIIINGQMMNGKMTLVR